MKFKGDKSIQTRRNNFVLLFVIFFCPQLLAEVKKEIAIDSLLGKEFIVTDFLDSTEADDEKESLTSRSPKPSVHREAPTEPNNFHGLNELASDETFSIFVAETNPASIVPRNRKPVPQVLVVEQKIPKNTREPGETKVEARQISGLEPKKRKSEIAKNKYTAFHGFPNDPSSPLAKLIGEGLKETSPKVAVEKVKVEDKPAVITQISEKKAAPVVHGPILDPVTVTLDADRAKLNKDQVKVPVGQSVPFWIQKTNPTLSSANVFVRDRSIVDWNEKEGLLTAHKTGLTEIYVYYANQLLILPVQVGAKVETGLDLPKALAVLEDVSQTRDALASFIGGSDLKTPGQGRRPERKTEDQFIASEEDSDEDFDEKQAVKPTKISENPSFDFIEKIEASQSQQKFDIKIVDERTDEADNRVYPVAGVEVKLVGTSMMSTTDSLGMVSDVQIPKKSRFLVSVKDPYQRYQDTTVEVSSEAVDEHNAVTIRVLQQVTFDAYVRIINGDQTPMGNSSVCAKVQNVKGEPLAGVSVTLDPGKGIRPYYFNRYGIFDPSIDKTSQDGRFCYFNLEPGPFAFFFRTANGEQEAPAPMTLFAGSHLEHNFKIGDTEEVNSVLAVSPTAFERWHGQMSNKVFRSIDYATLNPLGSEEEWQQSRDSMTMFAKQTFYDGRSYYLSRNAEFEDTLYRIDAKNSQDAELVTPLIPRGFLENISNYSNIIRESDKGTIFIEHGKFAENDDADNLLEVSLLDQNGNVVGEKVPLSGVSSGTLFFNVPTGTYTVTVKSVDGVGLDFDTVLVYSDTLSYLRTGSQLQRVDTNQDQIADGSGAN